MGKLEGKVALITGGSSGIGLAAATRFVEEGAHVFITGRGQADLEKAERELGRNVTALQGDIANLDDLDRIYARITSDLGGLDIVVANAAFVELVTLAESTPEHFDKTFNVNVRGTFFTVHKALPLLREGGSIVLVTTSGHVKGVPMYGTYLATKAALRSYARSWAAELTGRKIRVNTISPGPIETPIIDKQFQTKEEADGLRAAFRSAIPLGRLGEADEVAAAILHLASDDSSFTTGADLFIDGGLSQV
ncbi:SDR family oxidoreductase (plasmid) [Sinorhizobium sp. B11]